MASPTSNNNVTKNEDDFRLYKFYEEQFAKCHNKIEEAQKQGSFQVSCDFLSEPHKQLLRDRNIAVYPSQASNSKTWLTSPGVVFRERLTAGEHFDCESYNLPCKDLDYDYDPKLDFNLFRAQVEILKKAQ